ncbi:MAG TPA: DbpA RNA binding domain-containing protein, partial [Flavihumibacter sp.]|nr:DbpA RNA binding domain-containing protein [Flavihumibacter sp.]
RLLQTDISHGNYEAYVPTLMEKFADVSKEEILQKVVATEFDRFLKYYENAEDLNLRDDRRSKQGQRDSGAREGNRRGEARATRFESPASGNLTKLFVNLGTKDGFYKASFLQFILDMSDLRKDVLGRIDMKEMNSWVEIEKGAATKMIKAIDGKTYKGRRIRMNDANR